MRPKSLFVFGLVIANCSILTAATPQWIWTAHRNNDPSKTLIHFEREWLVPADIKSARVTAVGNHCRFVVGVNRLDYFAGVKYLRGTFAEPFRWDFLEFIQPGKSNRISMTCLPTGGPSAVMLKVEWQTADGTKGEFVTDRNWRCEVLNDLPRWTKLHVANPDQVTQLVKVYGSVARFPWGSLSEDKLAISPVHDYSQWKRAISQGTGTDPATFEVPNGFEVRTIRSAQEGEGSWVCMTFDPRGRIIVAQEKSGLLRLSHFNDPAQDVKVERINDSLKECRGLAFVGNDLYAMANNDKALFLLRDTNSDDQFDSIEKITAFDGGVGHGRNQITLGPDGRLYAIFGDSVDEPESFAKLPPGLARPNDIERTQSGFVARMNLKTREWTVVVRGLRNPYGIAFNKNGDMFTYDADAEYDMGAPWYRPTRVLHLIPGGDYGWRRVTKRWPPYYPDRPDMPQPTLDIGKGSPTGVAFGTSVNFPHPYSSALFVLDWSYGRIIAVHLEPHGSSYEADAEVFLRGQPLNVTDVEFGPDGAMYFTTGGRGTQSGLYRVEYTAPRTAPPKPTLQQVARREYAATSRAARQRMEAHFRPGRTPDAINQAIETAGPFLGSDDPWLRHTARTVFEYQPESSWRRFSFNEAETLALFMAQFRVGSQQFLAKSPQQVKRMLEVHEDPHTETEEVEALYLLKRSVAESAEKQPPTDMWRIRESNATWKLFGEIFATHEDFVGLGIDRLLVAEDDADRLHWLLLLSDKKASWKALVEYDRLTFNSRLRDFARELNRIDDFVGGEGLPTFRRLIRDSAVSSIPATEQEAFKKLLEGGKGEPWLAEIDNTPRRPIREWLVTDFQQQPLVDPKLGKRDPKADRQQRLRGRKVFFDAKCVVCHRVIHTGGFSGPNLTSLAHRFTPRNMLESILEPSRVVSEKYRNSLFVLKNGRTHVGRLQPGDYRSDEVRLIPNLLEPNKTETFKKVDVEEHRFTKISPMPKGLLDGFTRSEIVDLLAYLMNPIQP